MTLEIFESLEQGSDQWLDARRGILTASVMGKLITSTGKVADNETSRSLALTLAAERITGHVEYIHPSFAMQRGSDEEPIARAVYEDNYATVREIGFMKRQYEGFVIGFSPDGLVGSDGLIEIKSRNPAVHFKTVLSGRPPAENMAQLMVGLLISQRSWIDYCSFSAGLPFWTVRVYPDQEWFDTILAAAAAFEITVTDIVTRFEAGTIGLPATERRPDFEEMSF